MLKADHFIKDYRALVSRLRGEKSEKEAMAEAVGGSFDAIGQIEADLLRMFGLKKGMKLIDLGCGSGRAAVALARDFDIQYHGIDIVEDLIDFARKNTPSTYRYSVVEELRIPDADASVDMVCAFSLFTHLTHDETYVYLLDVLRVLKPGGTLLFSFLEFHMPHHWSVFQATVDQTATRTRIHMNTFIERGAITVWARHLGFGIEAWQDGNDGYCIPLTRPVTKDDGEVLTDNAALGQSVCVLKKLA